MKINLTRLLEAEGRVKWIKAPEKESTASFTGINERDRTCSDRAYSFPLELESVETTTTGEGE